MRLVTFAISLDAGPLLEVLVDDAALLRAHRIQLDALAAAQCLLGSPIGPRRQGFAATLAVTGRVDNNPLALAHPAEGRLVGKQLQRIDRLPALTNQQTVIVVTGNGSCDAVVLLPNLDLTVEVKLIENALDNLPNPLSGLLWPVVSCGHAVQSMHESVGAAGPVIEWGPPPLPVAKASSGAVPPFDATPRE